MLQGCLHYTGSIVQLLKTSPFHLQRTTRPRQSYPSIFVVSYVGVSRTTFCWWTKRKLYRRLRTSNFFFSTGYPDRNYWIGLVWKKRCRRLYIHCVLTTWNEKGVSLLRIYANQYLNVVGIRVVTHAFVSEFRYDTILNHASALDTSKTCIESRAVFI